MPRLGALRIIPKLANTRVTPFEQHVIKQLVYTPELVKSVVARRFLKNMSWLKITAELNITQAQAVHAYNLGRRQGVNEHWSKFVPALSFEEVVIKPPPEPPKQKPAVTEQDTWPSDLVKWVIAQHEFKRFKRTDIVRSLQAYPRPPTVGLGLEWPPSYSVISAWVTGSASYSNKYDVTEADLQAYDFIVTKAKRQARKTKQKHEAQDQ